MSGDKIHIGGSVSTSIVGGSNHSLRVENAPSDVERHLERLLGALEANVTRRPEGEPGRAELLEDLDGLRSDLDGGADAPAVERRLSAVQSWAEMLGLVSTATAVAQAVKQLLAP